MVVHLKPNLPDSERGLKVQARCTKDRGKASEPLSTPGAGLTNGTCAKALSDRPALQPYWGKPAVRNDRGDGGNVGIIRSPLRATVLPDRMLRELSRSYLTIVKDLSRVMNRLKAVYRSWAIPCAGRDVYYTRNRAQWLAKIREAGVRRRAERLYEHLDMLRHLRQQARRELLAESRKHAITAKLRQIPYLGPIRSALAVALIQTPHQGIFGC